MMTEIKISLLTQEEYEKYKDVIPQSCANWWLKDHNSEKIQFIAHDYIKSVSKLEEKNVIHSIEHTNEIRPVLWINENLPWKPGDTCNLFGLKWTVLDNCNQKICILCNESIATHQYDESYHNWMTSSLNILLNKWMRQVLSVKDEREYVVINKRFRKNNQSNKRFNYTQSLRQYYSIHLPSLIKSVMLQYIIFMFFLLIVLFMSGSIDIYLSLYFYSLIFREAVRVLFILCDNHKDTLLSHVLNIILSCMLYILLKKYIVSEIVLYAALIIVFFINNLVREFLNRIKYYS